MKIERSSTQIISICSLIPIEDPNVKLMARSDDDVPHSSDFRRERSFGEKQKLTDFICLHEKLWQLVSLRISLLNTLLTSLLRHTFPIQVMALCHFLNGFLLSISANRRVLLDFKTHPEVGPSIADGCCIDRNERLWIACFAGHRVICLDSTTGKRFLLS